MTPPVGHAERQKALAQQIVARLLVSIGHCSTQEAVGIVESELRAAALDEVATLAKQCEEMQVRLGKQEDEVVTLRAGRDKANALLDEWIEAQFFGLKSNDLRARTRAFLKSDEKPMPTPEAAELATLRARLTQMEAALQSIVNNSCCSQCQEAKMVALAGLTQKGHEMAVCARCKHPDHWHRHDDEACLSTHPQPCAPPGCGPAMHPSPFRCLGYDVDSAGFRAGTPDSRCGCPNFVAALTPEGT